MTAMATPLLPKIELQPPSVLLLGGPGSGKTYSLSTLLASITGRIFLISTEPTGLESFIDAVTIKKLDLNRCHWRAITPSRPGFDSLLSTAKIVTSSNFEQLSKLAPTADRHKAKMLTFISQLQNFTCDRTGQQFGPVEGFTSNDVLVVDSLSGLNLMAMDMVVGDKVSAHPGEWGAAMNILEKIIMTLTSGLKCTFVLTAHLERETDEITGASRIMASSLGRKLAPRLPRFFSEVVMTVRIGEQFFWSNSETGADLKRRALPLGGKLEPSFQPILNVYRSRLASIVASK